MPSSTPEQAENDPRQKIDFSDQAEGKIMIKAIPKKFFSAAVANDRCSSSGAAAGSLLSLSQDTRYIDLARMRLAVLHKMYWLEIRNKEKLVDFRSGSCPIDLEAGDPIL